MAQSLRSRMVLSVVVIMTLLLSACGSGAGSKPAAPSGGAAPAKEAAPPEKKEPGKLVVTSFGGDYEKTQREFIKEFEKEFNAQVEVVTLYSADALARIRAEKANPSIDVVQFSGGQEVIAAKENLIMKADTAKMSNINDLYSSALNKDGYGPTVAFDALGIIYNEKKVKTPPTSWNDLWNPEYKGHVVLADISNSFGLQFLVMAAKLNSGGEANMQPGFDKVKSLLPNATVVASTPEIGNLFAQEEAWIAAYDSGYAYTFRKQGQPVRYAAPKEGAMGSFINAQVVQGSKNADLAQQFINFLLRPDIQKRFAEKNGYAPTNKKVQLSDDLKAVMPYGEEAVNKLVPLNWELVNANRSKWTEDWGKLINKK